MWKLNQERSRRIPWIARPYVCPSCERALPEETTRCECGTREPDDGWPTLDSIDDPWLGRAFADHYVITKKAGSGVFGEVYRATTIHATDDYAIKLIDLSRMEFVDDEQALERIHREVRLLAKVRSPHVVKFHDVLELPNSVVGIVTSYVDGETLSDVMARTGPMEVERAAELGRQIAIGMSEIHRLGAVHRDLKPDNLLVQSLGRGQEFVHVIDFGISLYEGGGDTEGFWGTPLYASPEQALGEPLTAASDIYSLGACLWEMLVGEPPFPGTNLAEVLDAHIDDPLPDPTHKRAELRGYPQLVALLRQMLAKEPGRRPGSMSRVADELAEVAWGYRPSDDIDSDPDAESSSQSILTARTFETDRPNRFPTSPFFDADLLGHLLLSISPSGLVARVTAANELRTLQLDGDSRFPAKTTSPLPVNSVWAGDEVILTGHRDGTVKRWTTDERAETIHRDRRLAPVTALAEGNTARIQAAGAASGRISAVVETHSESEPARPSGTWQRLPSGKPVTSLAVNESLDLVAVGRTHGEVEVFQYMHGIWERITSMYANGTPVDLRFSTDAYLLAVSLMEGRSAVFSIQSGEQIQARRTCRTRSAFVFSGRAPSPCTEDCQTLPESVSLACSHLPLGE